PNAEGDCSTGSCVIKACRPGAFDANKTAADGCECLQSNGGIEICDTQDNNCDGVIDDGFKLDSDVNNCGVCGKRCIFPFAKASCAGSMCKMDECLPGFYDLNKVAADGCEYACIKSNMGKEICDGQDNDCNGMIDDGITDAPPACSKTKGVC